VKIENPGSPNKRTPSYVRGRVGIITACYGEVVDREFDHDHRVSWGPLYTAAFESFEGNPRSRIFVDIHESWLELLEIEAREAKNSFRAFKGIGPFTRKDDELDSHEQMPHRLDVLLDMGSSV